MLVYTLMFVLFNMQGDPVINPVEFKTFSTKDACVRGKDETIRAVKTYMKAHPDLVMAMVNRGVEPKLGCVEEYEF